MDHAAMSTTMTSYVIITQCWHIQFSASGPPQLRYIYYKKLGEIDVDVDVRINGCMHIERRRRYILIHFVIMLFCYVDLLLSYYLYLF